MTRRTATDRWRRGLWATPFVLLFVLSLVAVQGRAQAGPALQPVGDHEVRSQDSAADGEALFQSTCVGCHTVGGGDGVGPDLQGVTTRRDLDWLERWLADPPQMIADGDPIATEMLAQFNNLEMPSFGLSETQISALIAFFEAEDGGSTPPQAVPATTGQSGDGDADAGKNLFTGVTRLENGGPSCRACHSTGGIGGLGGGKLGPDLTASYAKLGDALVLWPETSQTMRPIFTDKPLTDQEKADLLAFFSSTDVTKRPTEVIWQLVGLALVGVALMAVAIQLIWRRRLRGVRIPMVSGDR